MNLLQLFLTLYLISVAFIYAFQRKAGTPFTLPGDIYIHMGTKRIYIPLGSSLIATIILFLLTFRFVK